MSLFVRNGWPRVHSVWFTSQVPDIIGSILLWRIHPTPESYQQLMPEYRPSAIQLSVPHSAIIDWVPYAPLRDRIILYYNKSASLDRLMCDLLDSYVVEVENLSSSFPGAPSVPAYFGVWNLYSAIDAANDSLRNEKSEIQPFVSPKQNLIGSMLFNSPNSDQGCFFEDAPGIFANLCSTIAASPGAVGRDITTTSTWKRPENFNLYEVLATPALVFKLAHDIRLYASKRWRLDRSLFSKWPELKFDGYENVVAKGRSCRLATQPPDGPTKLDAATQKLYQETLHNLL